MIVSRRIFDIVNEWRGGQLLQGVPIFVVTHEPMYLGYKCSFTFVTGGVENAVQQAKEAVNGKDISIGTFAQQYIRAKIHDEMDLYISRILLGSRIRLFEKIGAEQIKLENEKVGDGCNVIHFNYRLIY